MESRYSSFFLKDWAIESFTHCKLIGAEGCRLLRDKRSGETLKGAKRQGAHRLPRGKRATWSGNQPHSKPTINTKKEV